MIKSVVFFRAGAVAAGEEDAGGIGVPLVRDAGVVAALPAGDVAALDCLAAGGGGGGIEGNFCPMTVAARFGNGSSRGVELRLIEAPQFWQNAFCGGTDAPHFWHGTFI